MYKRELTPNDVVVLGNRSSTLETSPTFDEYSKVVINVGESQIVSGSDTGRTLTTTLPQGTQEIADYILSILYGFKYQPYTAKGALLDPAAELGDGISLGSIYSGIYKQRIHFNTMYSADIEAPSEEVIDHEFPYEPQINREHRREIHAITTELSLQDGKISAKVSKKVGWYGVDSFGWELESDHWSLYSGNEEVVHADKYGLSISGRVKATSGEIGGFTIKPDYFTFNNQSWKGTNNVGIYFGPEGLQIGKNFSVTNEGELYADYGKIAGFKVTRESISSMDLEISHTNISWHDLDGQRLASIGQNYYGIQSSERAFVISATNRCQYIGISYENTLKLYYAPQDLGEKFPEYFGKNTPNTLNITCDLDGRNHEAKRLWINTDTCGGNHCITDTLKFEAVTEFASDGTARSWRHVTLEFKNGFLRRAWW